MQDDVSAITSSADQLALVGRPVSMTDVKVEHVAGTVKRVPESIGTVW